MNWTTKTKYSISSGAYTIAKYMVIDEAQYQAWLGMEAIGYPCKTVKEAKERCERHLQIMGPAEKAA
jgi:hypothetical protein